MKTLFFKVVSISEQHIKTLHFKGLVNIQVLLIN